MVASQQGGLAINEGFHILITLGSIYGSRLAFFMHDQDLSHNLNPELNIRRSAFRKVAEHWEMDSRTSYDCYFPKKSTDIRIILVHLLSYIITSITLDV